MKADATPRILIIDDSPEIIHMLSLLLAVLTAAVSLVVSGSVVVVGELVYWLEAKGRCLTVPGF